VPSQERLCPISNLVISAECTCTRGAVGNVEPTVNMEPASSTEPRTMLSETCGNIVLAVNNINPSIWHHSHNSSLLLDLEIFILEAIFEVFIGTQL
jgi:hypothetical protein